MKLGDIKLEALKLMFANENEDIGIEQLPDLPGSEAYGQYLIGMVGSINRCFADLEGRGILPTKAFLLPRCTGPWSARLFRFDLQALIPDYFSLERLIYETDDFSCADEGIAFRAEEAVLRLPWFDGARERYRVIYRPRLPRIFPYTAEDTELPIPDDIAAFIPYWIKGELFREDEPNEAGEARNWYEDAMSRAAVQHSRRDGKVMSIFAMTEV